MRKSSGKYSACKCESCMYMKRLFQSQLLETKSLADEFIFALSLRLRRQLRAYALGQRTSTSVIVLIAFMVVVSESTAMLT